MSTHWRKILESEYLAGADLDDGNGKFRNIVATIKTAKREEILEPGTSKKESCLVLHFSESIKPMICNVTNAKNVTKATGTAYIEEWSGKQITIKTEKVKAFGELWDALRIVPYPPKQTKTAPPVLVPCADCKANIVSVNGVPAETIIAGTQKSYGRPLCMACANAAKQRAAEQEALENIAEIDEVNPYDAERS